MLDTPSIIEDHYRMQIALRIRQACTLCFKEVLSRLKKPGFKRSTLNAYVFFLLAMLPCFCQAQITGFKNYTQEDGLNSSFGYRIRQDRQGFIWIGGDNGLFRFDGTEFKQYNEKPGFKNMEVIGCEPLVSGEVFIIPFLGVNGYLKHNTLITSENNPELKKLQFEHYLPLLFRNDSMDQLFIGISHDPKSVYIYKNEKVSEFPIQWSDTLDASPHHCFMYDFKNTHAYFLQNGAPVVAYNIRTKKETPCNLRLDFNKLLYGKYPFVVAHQKDRVLVYELISPFRFKEVRSFKMSEKIYQAIIDDDNHLWLCLNNGGVLYFDQDLREANTSSAPLMFLEEYIINDVLKDRDGNVWFNTKNNGIFFASHKAFKAYVDLPVKNNAAYLTAIAANKTSVFMGQNTSRGSIYQSRNISGFVLDKNNNNDCRAVFANEKVAVFCQSGKIYCLDLKDHHIDVIPNLLSGKNIVPYTSGSVLICTGWALYEYDLESRKIGVFLKGKTYTGLVYDQDSLFVGSFKDLYKVDIKTKKKTLFLRGYYFNDLKKISHQLYAGATKRGGILLFNSTGVLKQITERDGLASDQIKKIAVENEHTIWASTSLGLSRISLNGNTSTINNFTRTDGLPSDRVSDCVIKNDTIYVATSKGLGIIAIHELLNQEKSINKNVIINSVSYGGKEVFEPTEAFAASYPDNTVIFNLSFLDYASQGKISYRYKTEGLNQDWQISQSSKIILNTLPPGKYTFKVYGLGYNGRQSDHVTAFSFEIKPLFWQSRWFYTLIVLTLAGALILLITYLIKRRRDKKLRALVYEKKIAELELQAIKAQINPHFIYNCLNSIQFLLYKKEYGETENYLDRFSKMIRKTLLYSEKTFMPIQEEIDYLTLYLDMEKLRLKGSFRYEVHVAGNVNKDWKIPSLLIQPFVENAIKHGISQLRDREGVIDIRFEYHGQRLCILIRDNGLGMGKGSLLSKRTDAFGIKLSRKRIEAFRQLFDADITIEISSLSENGKHGTEIKLYLNSPS